MRITPFAPAAALLGTLVLGACVTVPDSMDVESIAQPEGTPVALGQPVFAGNLVVTPARVLEDSRCPRDVQCVWAGRLVVETRIDGRDWFERVSMTLGEPKLLHSQSVTLISARPAKENASAIPAEQYRFVFESSPK